ncbi:hypothetical protein ACEOWG_000607 [Bacillus cereus]
MKKLATIVLAGSMALGLALPVGQASAATLSKEAEKPNYGHERPPEGAIKWEFLYSSEGWKNGRYVVVNTYEGYVGNYKYATKYENIEYSSESKKYKLDHWNRVIWP